MADITNESQHQACDGCMNQLSDPKCSRSSDGTIPCTICHALDQVESEIQEAHLRLMQLQGRHRELLTQRNAAHDLFERFPTELRWKILQQAHGPFQPHARNGLPRSLEAERFPVIVSTVSKAWEAVALSSPRLWTAISLTISPQPQDYGASLRGRIIRSNKNPLSLHISSSTARNQDEDINIQRNVKALLNYIGMNMASIAILVFDLPSYLLEFQDPVNVPSLHILNELHVHVETGYNHPLTPALPDNLKGRFAARKLCVHSMGALTLNIDPSHAEDIELHNYMSYFAFPIISQSSQLSRLLIELNGFDGSLNPPQLPIVKSSLKDLTIVGEITCVSIFAIATLVTPSLRNLQIYFGAHTLDGHFSNFLLHCSSTLTTLKLDIHGPIHIPDFISALQHCPEVTSFALQNHRAQQDNIDTIISHLRTSNTPRHDSPTLAGNSHPPLLPKLQNLDLGISATLEWSGLIDMVVSRQLTPSLQGEMDGEGIKESLQHVYVRFVEADVVVLDADCIGRLTALLESGTDISIYQDTGGEVPNFQDIVQSSKEYHNIH